MLIKLTFMSALLPPLFMYSHHPLLPLFLSSLQFVARRMVWMGQRRVEWQAEGRSVAGGEEAEGEVCLDVFF